MEEAQAIGIDLGTTYSSVGVFQHGKVEIIANNQGNRTTPSIVGFTDTERLIGDAAKDQVVIDPSNTVFNVKRLIGKKYTDLTVQSYKMHWPFEITNDCGKPKIKVKYKSEDKTFSPEEISSMILSKMKETAESYMGQTCKDAVITVPAYFNNTQRQAVKDAGLLAGLNVLRIINEPTAAAIAYGMDNESKGERNVLIFDLGGGTLDVSVLTIDDGIFEVKSTAGDNLGGVDFDNQMLKYIAEYIEWIFEKDIESDIKAWNKLRIEWEKAKIKLSSSVKCRIKINSLMPDLNFNMEINRSKFEEMCEYLFNRTLIPVEKVLRDAKLDKNKIQDIILVGGSTRIPRIQKMLQDFFNGKELNKCSNYDVIIGTTLLAENITKRQTRLKVSEIIPFSIEAKTVLGINAQIFDKNSKIPTSKTQIFTTHADNQPKFSLAVMEVDDFFQNIIKRMEMETKSTMKNRIEVTFNIDENGILSGSFKNCYKTKPKPIKPMFSKVEFTDKVVKVGEKFIFDFIVLGYPRPKTHWINLPSNVKVSKDKFVINKVTWENNREYEIVGENENGIEKASFNLLVRKLPDKPTGSLNIVTNGFEVTLSWDKSDSFNTGDSYLVEYRGSDDIWNFLNQTLGSSFVFNLEKPDKYQIRLGIINEIGVSEFIYSDWFTLSKSSSESILLGDDAETSEGSNYWFNEYKSVYKENQELKEEIEGLHKTIREYKNKVKCLKKH